MTTPEVIKLIHCVDITLIAKTFLRFKSRYGNLWSNRASNDEEWQFIIEDWLGELKKFRANQVEIAIDKALSIYKDFPPTLGHVIDLCLKESGMPQESEIINKMVSREFDHPVIKMIYDKIGHWSLSNSKSEYIIKKTNEFYPECVAHFLQNPDAHWNALNSFNSQQALPPPVETKKSDAGYQQWRKDMDDWKKNILSEKMKLGHKEHPLFPENKIKKGHRDFDEAVFNEYKRYLLSVPETETLTLPVKYCYDRMRFLTQIEALERCKSNNITQQAQKSETPRSGKNGPSKVYYNFMKD